MGDILQIDLNNSLYSFPRTRLQKLEESILDGKPFQYLLHEVEFFHHRFYVNENVLIPRPETEMLIDMITRSGKKFENALDVGTGSGVIILSLVKAKAAKKGMGSDISDAALSVAKINRQRLRLKDQVELIHSDRLSFLTGTFDLIVSNPPYIRSRAHRELVQESVHRHEPHTALYLDDSDFEYWFQDLFEGVQKHLAKDGQFWMEGHEKELHGQAEALQKLGFRDVKVLKDLGGLDRYLVATAPV